jgi:plasmid stabilization system protein ParE
VAKLHYTRRAREDLFDIWLYIAPRNSDALADAIYDRIEESCARLAQHPQLGRARPDIAARALVSDRAASCPHPPSTRGGLVRRPPMAAPRKPISCGGSTCREYDFEALKGS